MYRCETQTVSSFIRHLAVNYVSRGYFFYVKGDIPPCKDPVKTDAKIIERYGIDISKWSRWRRRQAGQAGVQYLRCRRQFVIIATHGEHHFFRDEAKELHDIRRIPFRYGGYSVSYRERGEKGYVSVRISRDRFEELKLYLTGRSLASSSEELLNELRSFEFPPFVPVRRQILKLVYALNAVRRVAGIDDIPLHAVFSNQKTP
jgi:hypothetical protein